MFLPTLPRSTRITISLQMDLRGSPVTYELLNMTSQKHPLPGGLRECSSPGQHDVVKGHLCPCDSQISENNSTDSICSRTTSQDQLVRSEQINVTASHMSTSVIEAAHRDGPGNSNVPDTETAPRVWLVVRPWFQEMAACILSAAAISAVVATLYLHQGRPLPEWPLKISINAAISIYSVVLKVSVSLVVDSCIGQLQWLWFRQSRSLYDAIRYDEATRGPWGSVKLLRYNLISRPTASFAAIISILTIAVDPFFQQILSYSDCQVPMSSANATIPRTSYFDKDHVYQSEIFINHAAKTALNAGVLVTPGAMPSSCLTGNCTFSIFSTLGLCSSCEDISETLVTSVTCNPDSSEYCSEFPLAYTYTSALPSGTRVEWGGNVSLVGFVSTFFEDTFKFEFLVPRTLFSDRKIDPSTGKNLTACINAPSSDWRCRGYGAANCAIYPCVRTYNTSITTGKTSELLVAQTSMNDIQDHIIQGEINGSPMVWINASCLALEEADAMKGKIKQTDGTWLMYNATDDMQTSIILNDFHSLPQILNLSESIFTKQCVYTCDGNFIRALSSFFRKDQFLIGNVTSYSTIFGQNSENSISVAYSSQNQLQFLYNSGNMSFGLIQKTFDNIADTFTQYMRENGNENYTDPALGVVYHYATCLDVNWPWISLPAALSLGALLLLFVTQSLVARGGIPVWKSSPLPYMYRIRSNEVGTDLDKGQEKTGGLTTPTDSLGAMKETAKATRMTLDQSAQGTTLLRLEKMVQPTRPN